MVNKCDCIVAFHIGHSCIEQSKVMRKKITNDCCGGVMLINYCPKCGKAIQEKKKYENWRKIARRKEVKSRIKYYKEEPNPSNFQRSILESYEEELIELNDVIRGADE